MWIGWATVRSAFSSQKIRGVEVKREKEPCFLSEAEPLQRQRDLRGPLPGLRAGSLVQGVVLRRLRLWRLLHWASGEGSVWASPQGPAVPPAQRDHSREGSAGRSLSLTWGLRYVFLAAAPMRDHKYTRDPQSVPGSYSQWARWPCHGMGHMLTFNPAAAASHWGV